MDWLCEKSALSGKVLIPGSKSHTIRAVAIGALADGESHVVSPLESQDTSSALTAYGAMGSEIRQGPDQWTIQGFAGMLQTPENVIDVANSGTTLNIAMGSASLLREGTAVFTGDEQIRRRPSGPLAKALTELGARVESTRRNGCPPFVVSGTLRGGETRLEAVNSQYVTSLLINAPLAENDTVIRVPVLYEQPYVWMTLDWLRRLGVTVAHPDDLTEFHIAGRQQYTPFTRSIPGDFSSATFFLAAGALPGNDVTCLGLDMNDTQGDRAVVDYLRHMGAGITIGPDSIRVRGHELHGAELDLNATPDALPMMAALACFARGKTKLANVPQARMKETDRIDVMCRELTKLGARVSEFSDGMEIEESVLRGGDLDGHGDHRIIMALTVAGCAIPGRTRIHGCEAASVTIPRFAEMLLSLGAKVQSAA